jgi:hypothetical protein
MVAKCGTCGRLDCTAFPDDECGRTWSAINPPQVICFHNLFRPAELASHSDISLGSFDTFLVPGYIQWAVWGVAHEENSSFETLDSLHLVDFDAWSIRMSHEPAGNHTAKRTKAGSR